MNVREVYPDHHFRFPPRRRGSVDALVILLHGVGSSAHAMKPAADEISLGLGHAAVVTLNGIEPFDLRGSGFQWFSVAGVTDADRARRVAEALPRVEAMIESECARANVSRERTAVVGFSQGAIMALHLAASLQRPPTAIVSWAGRIAPPQQVLGRLSPTTKIPFPAAPGRTSGKCQDVPAPQLTFAAETMGADAGLHTDQARRQIGEPRFHLAA